MRRTSKLGHVPTDGVAATTRPSAAWRVRVPILAPTGAPQGHRATSTGSSRAWFENRQI